MYFSMAPGVIPFMVYDPIMPIEAVLFDAADTLFTTRGSVGEIYGRVAREYGCTASFDEIQQAFNRQFRHSGPLSAANEKVWWRDVVRRVFSEVGMIREFNRFFEQVYDQFRDSRAWILFPETREVLSELRQRDLSLGVISNFDSRIYGVMEELGILSFFKSVTISSETGFAKPSPEIFEIAAKSLRNSPSQILLIGDSLNDDVLAGSRSGLHTALVDRRGRYADFPGIRRIESLREVFGIL
jgi:putative hydrolase of the HAD superfamily